MKKLVLSVMLMVSSVLAANAVTYMRVKTTDGQVVKYDVEKVTEVDFEEETYTPSDSSMSQGVTVSGTVGNYTYVDMGLPSGLKWATYNVGATKPTEYGDYFAWGETKPKEDFSVSTYKWWTVNADGDIDKITKYNRDSDYGTVDSLTVLEPTDDAATANWGSAWRMPSEDEIMELVDGCSWDWVDFKGGGVNGLLGTSKANGNIIFLPAAGGLRGTDLNGAGSFAYYWSSTLSQDNSGLAFSLGFDDSSIGWVNNKRLYGFSVRAVTK